MYRSYKNKKAERDAYAALVLGERVFLPIIIAGFVIMAVFGTAVDLHALDKYVGLAGIIIGGIIVNIAMLLMFRSDGKIYD